MDPFLTSAGRPSPRESAQFQRGAFFAAKFCAEQEESRCIGSLSGGKKMDSAMTPTDFYQLRAVECFILADQISDLQERKVMHELALCWLRLLERAHENRQLAARRDHAAA